ncbi:MAG: hypothetical protein JST43_00085 [Bacteroidetes bacterium]|nr:hypothetical protein [Bacteroidota bacterium]MBS1540853.1 hypothetical protein [Bacteroidota bacterium]
MITFSDLVDEVRKLDREQLEELEAIIQRDRIENARKKILKNIKKAKAEEKAGKLKFSSDINVLKKQLDI